MIITQTNLERFKNAYKNKHNISITDEQARTYGEQIINFIEILGKKRNDDEIL